MFKEAALLAVFAVILAFGVNAISPNGIALVGQWDTTKGVVTAKAKNDFVDSEREILLHKAVEYFGQGVLFVDARSTDEFSEGHIQGAVSLNVHEFFDNIGEFRGKYPDSTYMVCYCNGAECTDSHQLAEYLLEMGYSNVKVFTDGFPVWKEEGHPVGPQP